MSSDDHRSSQWTPDESSPACSLCGLNFDWQRWRHHCRACGAVVCASCSSKQMIVPAQRLVTRPQTNTGALAAATGMNTSAALRAREPKRVCDSCVPELIPLQEALRRSYANASQQAAEPGGGRFLGMSTPISFTMESEISKAAVSVRHFFKHDVSTDLLEDADIPRELLAAAKGIAFLTIVKFGIGVTYRGGTGLVVARLPSGAWSAPSAIGTVGVGWGAQLGAELTEFVILLNNQAAVDSFSGLGQVTLGAEIGIAAGPVGRRAGGSALSDAGSVQACYSYSRSKGLFVGISLEGAVIYARDDVNSKFYGTAVNRSDLLDGSAAQPRAAAPLYESLDRHLASGGGSGSEAWPKPGATAAAVAKAEPRIVTGADGIGRGGMHASHASESPGVPDIADASTDSDVPSSSSLSAKRGVAVPGSLAAAVGAMERIPRPGSPPTPIEGHGTGGMRLDLGLGGGGSGGSGSIDQGLRRGAHHANAVDSGIDNTKLEELSL